MLFNISIRACIQGATPQRIHMMFPLLYFNSRSRTGSDRKIIIKTQIFIKNLTCSTLFYIKITILSTFLFVFQHKIVWKPQFHAYEYTMFTHKVSKSLPNGYYIIHFNNFSLTEKSGILFRSLLTNNVKH